ncbi:MAG: hypothetical protein NT062_28270 [Proteobacteria bacterium]|nr:hypothetical protein [Pseudomonadota bacterium]
MRWIAAAIFFGCIVIAGGLYLGLRRAPSPQPRPATPRMPVVARATAPAEIEAALRAQQPALAAACWPTRAGPPASYTYDLTIDPHGHEIARGISESRDAQRAGVVDCLRGRWTKLTVPPPGVVVRVSVTLSFP